MAFVPSLRRLFLASYRLSWRAQRAGRAAAEIAPPQPKKTCPTGSRTAVMPGRVWALSRNLETHARVYAPMPRLSKQIKDNLQALEDDIEALRRKMKHAAADTRLQEEVARELRALSRRRELLLSNLKATDHPE